MQRYQTALSHLNSALEAMVEESDSLIVANIAHPIHLVEIAIDRYRRAIITEKDQDSGEGPPISGPL